MKIENFKAIERQLSKDPRYAGIVVQMKNLRLNQEMKNDQKLFFEKMVGLMTEALEKSKEPVTASTPGELMVKNVDSAALMVEVMKDFVATVSDKELEGSMVKQLKSLNDGIERMQKNMEEIAARKMPTPQVNVEQKTYELIVPEPKIIDQTKIIQETAEAKLQTKILEGLLAKLTKGVTTVRVQNENPDEAIPVRIVDKGGKKFIDQLVAAIGGAIAGGGEGGSGGSSMSNYALETGGNLETTVARLTSILAELQSTLDVTGSVTVSGTVLTDILNALLGTLSISGSVTANAGTNLNTSGLALESGGNLASILTQITAAAASLGVLDDWDESDRAKVNPIVGQAGVDGGSGVVSAKTLRVAHATDVIIKTTANETAATPTASGVAYTTASAVLFAANANLKAITLKNTSDSEKVSLLFAASGTAVIDQGITLMPGESWQMKSGDIEFWNGDIRGIGSGSGNLSIMSWT